MLKGLNDALAKSRISPCMEQKATRYRYKMRKVAGEKKRAEGEEGGIEGAELEDPLKFWIEQVKLHVFLELIGTNDNIYLGTVKRFLH